MKGGAVREVSALVRLVPPERVASSGQIAGLLGQGQNARLVGWALHSLTEGTDVPWHRVTNRQGRLHAGDLQRAMLADEGVEARPDGTVDLRRFGWEGLSAVEAEALRRAVDTGQNLGYTD